MVDKRIKTPDEVLKDKEKYDFSFQADEIRKEIDKEIIAKIIKDNKDGNI